VSAHGVVTAETQCLLHPRAWGTGAGPLEDRSSDAKAPALQRLEIDSGNHQIATKERRVDRAPLQEGPHHRKMLCLNEGNPARARAASVMIALQAKPRQQSRLCAADYLRSSRRSSTDPYDCPRTRKVCQKLGDGVHGLRPQRRIRTLPGGRGNRTHNKIETRMRGANHRPRRPTSKSSPINPDADQTR
jgi:hypothetical protein